MAAAPARGDDRPGPGLRARLLQPRPARAGRGLPRRPAAAVPRGARGRGGGAGRARARAPAPLRRGARRARRRPVLGAAAAGGGDLADARRRRPAARVGRPRAGRSTSGSRRSARRLAGRRRQVGGDRRRAGGARRRRGADRAVRRFGRRWWIRGSVAVVAHRGRLRRWLAPVVLAPLFNKLRAAADGPARSDVLELGRARGGRHRRGLPGGRQPALDGAQRLRQRPRLDASASSSTTHCSTSATGRAALGRRPRARARRAPTTSCAGSAWRRARRAAGADVRRQLATRPWRAGRGDDPRSPAALPALALALALASFVLGVLGNQLSRKVEARRTSFALELTDDPRGADPAAAPADA